MKILVINCGSSTVKFKVIEIAAGKEDVECQLAGGLVDRVGADAACAFSAANGQSRNEKSPMRDHEDAVRKVIDWLESIETTQNQGELKLDGVGHRVVHGGEDFVSPTLIDDDVIARIDALSELAPLHNPAAVKGIRATQKILGTDLPMVAVFDTSFHHTIPEEAFTYAIPHELTAKHRIRRFGFHGLAHHYSLFRYAQLSRRAPEGCRIITLHLGNGCSACAIRDGKSVDISMGFTPLEGLVMGTRSGDLDPALVNYLARKEGVSAVAIEELLNKGSGLLGLSGLSNDMRQLVAAVENEPRARLAVAVFCYRARKYLGAYLAVVGGAEAVIFSGGIGENAPVVRELICAGMEWCGLKLDQSLNATVIGIDGEISAPSSTLKAYVIHSDEETIIARETARIAAQRG